jgi:mono/diheme cytochrome c family protein
MPNVSQRGRAVRKVLLAGVLILICIAIGLGALHRTPWVIPPGAKELKNPLSPANANATATKQLYSDLCANCHGDGGKGDGSDAMMYDPTPTDLTDAAKMNKHTDGELYYQITEGRKPMPSFKKKLTEAQRWQMVMFVRALAGTPTAPPSAKQPDAPGNREPEPQTHPTK